MYTPASGPEEESFIHPDTPIAYLVFLHQDYKEKTNDGGGEYG